MPKFFISYRQADTPWVVEMLRIGLKPYVENPEHDIYVDIHGNPLGVDFAKIIDAKVAECDVLLAVIGANWLEAHDQAGKRRLDDPADFVRIEIASALTRGIPVVPILMDGATLPSEEELPSDLKPLVHRQGVEVRRVSFPDDLERMMRGLNFRAGKNTGMPAKPHEGTTRSRPVRAVRADGAGRIWLMAAIAALAIILTGVWIFNKTTQLEIAIDLPAQGAMVGMSQTVTGSVSNQSANVRLVIHPVGTNTYWVQQTPSVNLSQWEAPATFGGGPGARHEIRAVANPSETLSEGDVLSAWPQAEASSEIRIVTRN